MDCKNLPCLSFILLATVILLAVQSPPSQSQTAGVMLAPKTAEQHQAADLVMRGSQLMKQKKFFAARPLLEKAASLWPQSEHMHFNLACCYSETGLFEKAIAEYQTALRINPKMYECLANIASCYQLMDQPQEAIVWFETYLKQNPRARDANEVRGMINALHEAAAKQVAANPLNQDYVQSISHDGQPERWQPAHLPLRIFISNGRDLYGNPVAGFREYYNDMLLDALNTWVKASNYRLAYVLVTDAKQADIVCTWTEKKDFLKTQGNAVEQGVARVISRPIKNTREWEIGHANVIVLITDESGKQNASDDVVKKACLHELGHALGFAGHSTNNKDVMFFSDSPTVWASLTKRDKATMARLYADFPPCQPAPNIYPTTNDGALVQQQYSQQQQYLPSSVQ